jgi:hypothetical protein
MLLICVLYMFSIYMGSWYLILMYIFDSDLDICYTACYMFWIYVLDICSQRIWGLDIWSWYGRVCDIRHTFLICVLILIHFLDIWILDICSWCMFLMCFLICCLDRYMLLIYVLDIRSWYMLYVLIHALDICSRRILAGYGYMFLIYGLDMCSVRCYIYVSDIYSWYMFAI